MPGGGLIGFEEICLILFPTINRLPRLRVAPTPSKMRTLLISIDVGLLEEEAGGCCAFGDPVNPPPNRNASKTKHIVQIHNDLRMFNRATHVIFNLPVSVPLTIGVHN
jgi:hypothetical protein